MENLLEIKNLDLFIGKYQVLHDINLNLKYGELHALVGESGCGKSMTAMAVLRLIPKTAFIKNGQILFHKQNLLDLREKDIRSLRGNKIALIPQDPMTSLNPLYTVRNQLVEAIKVHSKVSERQALRKAKEVLDLVSIPDIDNKLNYYPHELSGGMKQRIIIAMALACKAELIIADEPTTALDVTIQKQIMDLLGEIKNEFKTTILLISHDLALVSNYADNISVMYSGYIVEKAPSDIFFKKPIHPYSEALLNSLPSINPNLKLKTIVGSPPSIQEDIYGYKFHPRCDCFKSGICDMKLPELVEKEIYHFVSCFER